MDEEDSCLTSAAEEFCPAYEPGVQTSCRAVLNRVADVDSRRRLHSRSSPTLLVPTTRRCTLGDRAFPAAAARAWNSLPLTVTSQDVITDVQAAAEDSAVRPLLPLTVLLRPFASVFCLTL